MHCKPCIAWTTQGCLGMYCRGQQLCACVCDLSDPTLHGCVQAADVMAACCVTMASSEGGSRDQWQKHSGIFEEGGRYAALFFFGSFAGMTRLLMCQAYRPVPGVLGALLSATSSSPPSLCASPPSSPASPSSSASSASSSSSSSSSSSPPFLVLLC